MEAQTAKGQVLARIKESYTNSLAYDVYRGVYRITLNGEVLTLDASDFAYMLLDQYDLDISPAALEPLLQKNSVQFNVVEEYLDRVHLEHGTNNAIDTLSKEVFSCKNKIEEIYVKKFLVSAVARVKKPGCKVDTMFVLRSSRGGLGKTSFFTELATLDYFSTIQGKLNMTELQKLCSNNWIVEFGELETLINKQNLAQFKGFLTAQVDEWRKFYQTSKTEKILRSYVIVGTTNKKQFLCDQDSENERRFWVVDIDKNIDIEWVKTNRDRLWAEAYHLYHEGYQWWLTEEETQIHDTYTKQYKNLDSIDEVIINHVSDNYIDLNKPFSITDILKELELPHAKYQKKASDLLQQQLGLEKPKLATTHNGKRLRWWNK